MQQHISDVRFFESAALFGIDEENKENYETSAWFEATGDNLAFAKYVYLTAQQYVRALVGKPASIESLLPTDAQLLTYFQSLVAAKGHIRVARSKNGFRIFLPVFYGNVDAMAVWADDWHLQDKDTLVRAINKTLPAILDSNAVIDMALPVSISGSITETQVAAESSESFDLIKKGCKSYRLVSPSCTSGFYAKISEHQRTAWDDGTISDYEGRRYVNALFQSRVIIMFMEFEVDMKSAEFICQTDPTMSLLGEYFIRMSEWLWDTDHKEFIHNVVPISKIAAANKANTHKTVPRTNEFQLSVNAKGNLLWIPSADNAEFVEQEIESGGMQPNGEWTRVDCIDPENTEFITTVDDNGRTRRVKRPKGKNRLMLTDWHNSRLSYTKDDGNMDIMDISMFRPAQPGQIAATLSAKITAPENRGLLSSIGFALERGKDLGVKVDMNLDWFRPWMPNAEAISMLASLNSGNVTSYIENANRILYQAIEHAEVTVEGGNRNLDAEELNALDPIWNTKWLSLDLLSVDSPISMLRPLAMFLRQTYDRAMIDPSAVFGRFVVRTTLAEMAALVIVVNYAGKLNDLRLADAEARKQYTDPDLSPTDQIDVKDIPYVSGKVSLFPHQVKAWNWLKNRPKNAVIDVAAGGGKTLLALLEIAYAIGQGLRWPLVICPDDLIKNYINDAQWLFAGKMNMVVLNNTTFNSKEWGEEKLLQLVEHAPPNTIFLTDYTFVVPNARSKRVQKIMYGTVPMQISLNNEFLKRVNWGGIWMDESHLIKNPFSIRNKELARLTCAIDYKREMSGTYISDNLTDVVGQVGLMDPQVFGEMLDFEEEFFSEGRRSAPIPGAQSIIRKRMEEHMNVITIRRKEWAALLPRREDVFYPVDMTPAQYRVYIKILDIQKEELNRKLKDDQELRSMLNVRQNDNGDIVEPEEVEINEDKLGFYLQRLERFLTAPGSDPLGAVELTGDDLKSPKLLKVEEIIRHHIAQKIPGKILIWTQYVESAAYMYRSLSPELQAKFVHYKSGDADAAMAEFKSNPNKIGMIGCEKSMNTGHNLQFCSRIIRLETVWNWGTLEQGESRINRPQLDDPRRHENGGNGIFYDWVFCNKSVDVTKNSRMISKLISTIKFYEQNNRHYQALDEPPPILLTKDNIFEINDWRAQDNKRGTEDDKSCERYFDVYNQYQVLEQQEFDAFLADPKNRVESYTLEEGHILPGSGLLQKIPYIPQMAIYNAEQLGLVPFTAYISSEYDKKGLLLVDDPDWSPEGMPLHTEFGDCTCRGYNKAKSGKPSSLRVNTPSGSIESVQITMAWVITKATTSGVDTRAAIAKRAGAKVTEVIIPKGVKTLPPSIKTKTTTRSPVPDKNPGFVMYCEMFDNNLSLVVNSNDDGVKAVLPELEHLGFAAVPPYWYAKVANFRSLRKWLDSVKVKLEIAPPYLKRLEADYEIWHKGQTLEKFAHGLANADRKNFLREQVKPADKGIIKPYLVIHGTDVFLCLNQRVNQASYSKVAAVKVPGVTWRPEPVADEHWAFFRTKAECQLTLKTMFEKYDIENRKELIAEFATMKLIAVKPK